MPSGTTLSRDLLDGERPLTEAQLHFVDDFDGIVEFRRWLSESRGRTILGADSETTGLDTYSPTFKVRLVQFGDENQAWTINCEKYPGIAQEALETYTDTDIAFHNASYDAVALMNAWPGFKFPWARVHDTMLYHRLHDSEKAAGLKPVSQSVFGSIATRGQDALSATMAQNGWSWATVPMSAPAYTTYAGADVILTARLWRRLAHIHSGEFANVARLEMDTLRICTEMSHAGMRIDRDYCVSKRDQLRGWVTEVMQILDKHHGINIRSSAQLARYFQGQGAVIHETTPKGAPSMGKETMERLAAEGYTVAKTILDVRKADKLASSYFDNLIDFSADDGSVHASINTIAARTGRMSITNPALQTLPAGDSTVRHAFLPDTDEQSIISCDFGQIELRLTAALSGDTALVDVFREADKVGGDFFTMVGERLYGAGFQKSDPRRKLLKNTIYGSSYGAGIQKMADSAKVPFEEMEAVATTLFGEFPGIRGIMDIAATEAERAYHATGRHSITNRYGRRVYVDADRVYSAANFLVQSTAADEMKRALVRIDKAGLGPYMRLPVHDEIVMSVPTTDADEIARELREAMTVTDDMGYGIPIPADPEGPWDRWKAK